MADQDGAGPAPASTSDGTGAALIDEHGPGRWLDVAGCVAAVVLAVIVADIWSGGRLVSARLQRWRGPGPQGGGGGDVPAGPADGH